MIFKSRTEEEYFEWLLSKVGADLPMYMKYRRILEELYLREFTWKLRMDENRAADGIQLRRNFEYETGLEYYDFALEKPCSVLEMLVALALRCEKQITGDEEPEKWFWLMLENLEVLDGENLDEKLYIFLERKYTSKGVGGLFPMKNPRQDMRKVEIWYQLNWYLAENYYDF